MTDPAPPRPTARDVAAGLVLGAATEPITGPTPAATVSPVRCQRVGVEPLTALERAVLTALRRPPCLVSFSGGLDSSLVLAVAVRMARREGLPEPVPATWRFTGAPRAEESAWQERVIDALGVGGRWEILRADDELDLVGPVAQRLLHRHGLLHPVNLHLHLPIVELAAGGAVLTGGGGDQVLAGWRRPAAGSAKAYLGRLPAVLRAEVRRHRATAEAFGWLRPEVARQVRRAYRAEERAEPHLLGPRIAWHLGRRDLRLTRAGLDTIAAEHGVLVVNPLLDGGFVDALTVSAGERRRPSRNALIAEIAAGAFPPVVTAPRRKARFMEVFFRAPTRDLVQSWAGGAVDPQLVDVGALRDLWSRWPIPGGTAALVQQVWLARNPPPDPVRAPATSFAPVRPANSDHDSAEVQR